MLRKLLRPLKTHLLTGHGKTSSSQERWNRTWSAPDYVPAWEARHIPSVLNEAVESGWFPPHSSLLDIGCGTGDMAAWIAGKGYRVMAIDFAVSAITRARTLHKGPELRYAVTDICKALPDPTIYDCLFDRGCLHGIPDADVDQYVANVRASSRPGSRFLLLFKTRHSGVGSAIQGRVSGLDARLEALRRSFAIARTTEINMLTGSEIVHETTYPGVALWLVRR